MLAQKALIEQALKIDPNEKQVRWRAAAYTYFGIHAGMSARRGPITRAKILGQANRAIALAPGNVWAYYVKKRVLDRFAARAHGDQRRRRRAIAINPDDPPALQGAKLGRKCSRPLRNVSEIRCAASDAVKSARSDDWDLADEFG